MRVYKRKSDKARGKAGKYTILFAGEDGRMRSRAGFTDKATSVQLGQKLETEARLVREGMVEPGEKRRREAALKPLSAHVADYRAALLASGDTADHVLQTASAIDRLLALAGIGSVEGIAADRIQKALGKFKESRSARTCNYALGAVKAFVRWLDESDRIARVPRGMASLKPYNQAADRRVVRRALTETEIAALLKAAEDGETLHASIAGKGWGQKTKITGPERAFLYRLALATGFRANELRTLTPERFDLDSPEPTITALACYTKNGKEAVQPIMREMAEAMRPFVASRPRGVPVVTVPYRTAQMLHHDLKVAGIPVLDEAGRKVDFHALRCSYITGLVRRGINPKIVQTLARHSSITLTLGTYYPLDGGEIRKALEDKK